MLFGKSLSVYQTTQRFILEDYSLHMYRSKILKPYNSPAMLPAGSVAGTLYHKL